MDLNSFKSRCLTGIFAANKESPELTTLFDEFVKFFGTLSGVDTQFDMNDWSCVHTEYGVAISPVQAAKCSQELLRSLIFMQGVKAAIEDKQQEGLSEVHILYAGTGPYATLLLPLLALHPNLPVRATLIDIHPENIAAVKKLIDAFDVEHRIERLVCCDALKWQDEEKCSFDIVISETMTALLKREPQVWIFKHLFPYLKEDGILIPESIALSAMLNRKGEQIHVGEFFNLQKSSVQKLSRGDDTLLRGELIIPDSHQPGDGFKLQTDIIVYGHYVLGENECSLNIPFTIPCEATNLSAGAIVKYEYTNYESPEFVFNFPASPRFVQDNHLAPIDEQGKLGLVGIKSAFQHSQLIKYGKNVAMPENIWLCQQALCEACDISLQDWLSQLYQSATLEVFEAWLIEQESRLQDSLFINELNSKLLLNYKSE
ncbi:MULTISPECIES: class I SAM-dependent methyltransferase [unclassified Pseudoalteromonas]|uniref:class I SAM-dependent methyltransferase n=1 Tax=unclassified Pseudoalteromonas TaxID=194690 RepID=UPI001EF43145|nr:class I SAM-dependent methyltransferase [Pseudoalteromonas sp. Of11M-6]MCG7554457.1 class I SAM-dependent methyltransferase [Pseudoalteromonas sp. Of11M-6]